MLCKGWKYMERRKLLLADDSDDFTLALTQQLEKEYEIRCVHDGKQALSMLRSFQPDLMVLEMMITELDGVSLLQMALAEGLRPNVLAVTRFFPEYVSASMEQLGIRYAIRKPTDLYAIADRIRDLIDAIPHRLPASDLKPEVTALLNTLGIPSKLHGYTYLREAILEILRNRDQSITKELYPAVAATCGCTRNQVERSIRTAIAAAWNKRDEEVWRKYLLPDSTAPLVRPTNSELIICLAEHIQMH